MIDGGGGGGCLVGYGGGGVSLYLLFVMVEGFRVDGDG